MDNLPRVEIPKDKEKIKQLIAALEQQLQKDTNEKDKEIHRKALEDLKASLNKKTTCKNFCSL